MFRPTKDKKEYLLYIGALTENKGVEGVINALAGSDEKFVIAGDGTQRPRLAWLADKRGVDANFIGYVADVPKVMRNAKALVFPSSEEGFGLAVLEAMAAGVPTISKKSEAIEEIVKDGKNGILYEDAMEIPKIVRMLDKDDSLRKRLIEAGEETAKRYTWDNASKRTLEIYKKVLGD
jgi:glycosyltransferase involved in cell wall biosynthesis